MRIHRHLFARLCLLAAGAVCLDASVAHAQQSITYVGKQSITDFTGYGQHLQYWPLFNRASGTTARRTDDSDCVELTPDFANFKHHYLLEGRTFSNDALGNPIGTKTRGGYPQWAIFTLPDGRTGRSGTFYDESNIDNSNNTVNEMRINVSTLHEFCLNLITDNTNGEHNPDVRFEARSDNVNVNLAGHPDYTFDGVTDMYTFRYAGMQEDDVFKIRMQCSSSSGCKGAGLGGIMVSDIATCTGSPPMDAGVDASATDAGSGDAGLSDAGAADTGPADTGPADTGPADTGSADTGSVPDAETSTDSGTLDGSPSGGDASTSGGPADTDAGCGCRTAGTSTDGRSSLALALLGIGIWLRRRRANGDG